MRLPFVFLGLAYTSAFAAETPASHWQTELNVRLRLESREQNVTFDSAASSPTDGTWLLTRMRVGIKGAVTDALAFHVQVQDAREFGSDRPRVPYIAGSEGDDPLDLRQLYFEYRTQDATVRAGRQLLAFGDERLVGPVDWNNLSRSFDAVRVTWPRVGAGLDAFAGSVVQVQPAAEAGWDANRASARDVFAGVYSRFAAREALRLEPYVFWRNKRADTLYALAGAGTARPYDIPQKIATWGVRWSGGATGAVDGFDYDGEFAWQTGEVRARQRVGQALVYPGPAWLDHNARAIHLGAGYTTSAPGFPLRFYAEFNHATGDKDPADARSESFLNLFPTNHKFYGGMDVFAWKNMREFALTATATFRNRTKIRLEHHVFALARTSDAWFRANAVTPVRPLNAAARNASRSAGQETDLVVSRPVTAWMTADAGFSYFAAGRYLQQTGAASDARFGYVQVVCQW